MDEIFDRIKKLKIRKKRLFVPLILTEILGILVLVWFLQVPLTQKYLTFPPSSYSVDSMDRDTQYLIRRGDFITGKTEPGSTLQLLLYPNGPKYALLTDGEGNFSFQIPQTAQLSEYRLIIINDEDEVNELIKIKDIRIRITSNNKIDRLLNR